MHCECARPVDKGSDRVFAISTTFCMRVKKSSYGRLLAVLVIFFGSLWRNIPPAKCVKVAIYVFMTNVVAGYSVRKGVINAKTCSSKFRGGIFR